MSDIDSLQADLEQKLVAADEAQKQVEAASAYALELAKEAQVAREALDAAVAAGLPPQTPAPMVAEPVTEPVGEGA